MTAFFYEGMQMRIAPQLLESLTIDVLTKHQTSLENATCVAKALVHADMDGLHSHGVARLYAYAKQAKNGKVDGRAVPLLSQLTPSALSVDAAGGFAYPAIQLGLGEAEKRVKTSGIVALSIGQSHHAGAIGQFIEPLAKRGLMVLAFSNATAAIAPAGGNRALFGTNPIAFSCPRVDEEPLLLDLSLSKVARGKIKLAADAGREIPEGWAVDSAGMPTTDAQQALEGALIPIGDSKGAVLAMMLELLCAGLSNSNYAYQAGSFFTEQGVQPRIGQLFILIDPERFNPHFTQHAEALFTEILKQEGTRIPGANRLSSRREAIENGIELDDELMAQIEALRQG